MRARTAATLVATVALAGSVVAVGAMAVPVVATAARVEAPESAAPVVTVTVTAPAPSASPTSSEEAYAGPLIAPTGSQVRTRAELHEWVETRSFAGQDPENDRIWEEQAWLDIRCMAKAGYLYDPIAEARQDASGVGLTEVQRDGYQAAMWGPPTSDPYDWRRAGCHGRSVHVTGQDDAH